MATGARRFRTNESIAAERVTRSKINSLFLSRGFSNVSDERQIIGERTKAALAAAKARGVRLGANGTILAERHKAEAVGYARQVAAAFLAAQQAGAETTRQIADSLNAMGVPSRQGGRWHPASVSRLQRRLALSDSRATADATACGL